MTSEAVAWRVPVRLPSETLRQLLRVDPYRGLLDLATQWALIFAIVALSERFWHPLLYAASALLIGGRQIALMLVVHDAVHHVLLRNRLWNDRLAEWFAAWPILMPFRSYRHIHRQHHLYLGTSRDPDFARNRPDRLVEARNLRGLVRLLLGLERRQVAVRRFWGSGDEAEREGFAARPYVRLGLYAVVVLAAAATGALHLLILYWLVPLGWFLIGMRLKGIGEHLAVPGTSHFDQSRSFRPTAFGSLLVAPLHAEYHIEHHLYPGVPHYRLPELHRELMDVPGFAGQAHVTPGYAEFFKECLALYRSSHGTARPAAP
jgi:fatty acid desaturase